MICTTLAKKMLTKKEQKHLSEIGIYSMASFLRTRKEQIKMQEKSRTRGHSPGIAEPCFVCLRIAQKLGIE